MPLICNITNKPLILFLSVFSFITITLGTAHATPVQVTDSRGKHTLTAKPVRPVVLSWDTLEQVIELGITPVGAPDLESYSEWVVQPAIPRTTKSVGTRSEPNLEKIASLNPDIIITSQIHREILPRLEQIAPVLIYSNFSAGHQHANVAIEQFSELAKVFGKEEYAQQKLTRMSNTFQALRKKITSAFPTQTPEVVAMRFADTTSAFLYTENSTVQYVLEQLGLKTAIPQPTAKWGIIQKPLSELQYVTDGYVLYLLPFAEEKTLQKSILWRAMPFVRSGHVNSVRSVWSYGGAMSLMYTAEAITESLLKLGPQS
ncbi:iron-hydroxamate ABC transporter substrate-binding protein [Vibrio albus]|uniref:Iron-hydroxamate ABC transporter substrate-binding protein n=1 Tax=Vibrio albus TaxID=2200953 RepID=A0A2U3B6R6_9VIBR|nr:iron-siderophore ABC transporter substrate-binding protein [Vibrio albus]PWI32480.1 iron-hydroxamate ABC transporter substrate-binding protein [Vibrio albus]